MQYNQEGVPTFQARWRRIVRYFKVRFDSWDRVYLCSMAPMSAEFVRDYEEAEQHHHQW